MCLNSPETILTTDLSKQERDELLPAGIVLGIVVAVVHVFQFPEFVSRKNFEQLSQNRRNLLHGLKLLLNKANRKGLVTFNIADSQEFSDLLYF